MRMNVVKKDVISLVHKELEGAKDPVEEKLSEIIEREEKRIGGK